MPDRLLSILISSYNGEKHLRQCLDSVFGTLSRENEGDVEFVVINDGSTDSTQEILENYRKRYDFRLINQQNMGVSKTRNKLISLAEGKYIYQIDHDDYLLPNALNKIVNYLKQHDDIDMLLFDYCKFENGKRALRYFKGGWDFNKEDTGQKIFAELYNKRMYNVPFWTRVVRRSCMVDNNIMYNVNIAREDIECAPRVFAVVKKMGYIPEAIYAYRQMSDTSQNRKNRCSKDYVKLQIAIVDLLQNFAKSKDLSNVFRKALYDVIGDLYWDVLDGIKYDGQFDENGIEEWKKRSQLMKYGKFERKIFYRFIVNFFGVKNFYMLRYRD